MNLLPLPAFSDNYIWMLHDGAQAFVVDPGDAAPVVKALDRLGLQLAAILVTHHHPDHVGGIDALRPRLQGPVYGPAHEVIPQPCTPLVEGDRVNVLGLDFEVIDVPGHTAGHIAYVQRGVSAAPLLFCGDTLFSAGCGRLFEGTPAQMNHSLAKLKALPGDARVCCTHEYTLSNLRFANAVEPGNLALQAHTVQCVAQRERGEPTLPSSIAIERNINPFLRCTVPEVLASARAQGAASNDEVDVFAALREWKNNFR
jgi:hydroxyacylglutathione hydrolase